MEFNTALLHQQFDSDTQNGATIPPIYQVSAFAQSSAEQLEKVFNNKAAGFAYTRISNPTVDAFERRVASMEKGIGAVELIGNPKLDVVDLKKVSALVHEHGVPLIIDSTTATPYLLHTFDFGADVIVHSSSKYINGGGNSISGVIIDSGNFHWNPERYHSFAEYKKYGKFAYLAKLRNGIWRNFGSCLAPMNAFMNTVGLETLGLRMERICSNAKQLAEYLESRNDVTVNYPALKSSPYYDLVQTQFSGKGGAILTLRAGSKEKAFKLINALKYAVNATNIGDVRTLVIHPASTIYTHSSEQQKASAGVYDDSIRISVGIEDINDLIADFAQAIDQSKE